MHIRRIGEPKTTPAPTATPSVSAAPVSGVVAESSVDSFAAAMETDEDLVCGVEDPEQCESCT